MIVFFILTGLISLFFSFLFLFHPHSLNYWNEYFNKILFTDEQAIIHRKRAGLFLLVASFLFSSVLILFY